MTLTDLKQFVADWKDFVTAVMAIYAAVLATHTSNVQRRQRIAGSRRRVASHMRPVSHTIATQQGSLLHIASISSDGPTTSAYLVVQSFDASPHWNCFARSSIVTH
jgi:hypothetical protein